jgi:hypothetical protein
MSILDNNVIEPTKAQGLGLIGQFTMNEDHTITIQNQLSNPSGSV